MGEREFQDFLFVESKDKKRVKVFFLKNFYFYLSQEDLDDLGGLGDGVKFDKHKVWVKNEKKFNNLLSQGFTSLKSALTDHDAGIVTPVGPKIADK